MHVEFVCSYACSSSVLTFYDRSLASCLVSLSLTLLMSVCTLFLEYPSRPFIFRMRAYLLALPPLNMSPFSYCELELELGVASLWCVDKLDICAWLKMGFDRPGEAIRVAEVKDLHPEPPTTLSLLSQCGNLFPDFV